ncbi:MAG: PLP-dependent lyase/thiolase, partial [Candidatus Omnitrophica bacterium]|nr:PLP-dependent lyase/thiolase [Candidatus Omnitrophota bacterium]
MKRATSTIILISFCCFQLGTGAPFSSLHAHTASLRPQATRTTAAPAGPKIASMGTDAVLAQIGRANIPVHILGPRVSYADRIAQIRKFFAPSERSGRIATFEKLFGAETDLDRPGEFVRALEPDPAAIAEFITTHAFGRWEIERGIENVQRYITPPDHPSNLVDGPSPVVRIDEVFPPIKQFKDDYNIEFEVYLLLEYLNRIGSFKRLGYINFFLEHMDILNGIGGKPGKDMIMFSSGNAIRGVLNTALIAMKLIEGGILRKNFKVKMVCYPKSLSLYKREKIMEQFGDLVEIVDADSLEQEYKDAGQPARDIEDLNQLHDVTEWYARAHNLLHILYSNSHSTALGGAAMLENAVHQIGTAPDMWVMGTGGGSPPVGALLTAFWQGYNTTVVGLMPASRPIEKHADSYRIHNVQSLALEALRAFGMARFQMADVFEEYIIKGSVDLNNVRLLTGLGPNRDIGLEGFPVEPSGGIPMAFLYMLMADSTKRQMLQGKKIALVLSGMNAPPEALQDQEADYIRWGLDRANFFDYSPHILLNETTPFKASSAGVPAQLHTALHLTTALAGTSAVAEESPEMSVYLAKEYGSSVRFFTASFLHLLKGITERSIYLDRDDYSEDEVWVITNRYNSLSEAMVLELADWYNENILSRIFETMRVSKAETYNFRERLDEFSEAVNFDIPELGE